MKWFRIDFEGVENKNNSSRNFITNFVAVLVKYDALEGLALYSSLDESNLNGLTCYCISCPDDISEKVFSSFSDCKIKELAPPDPINLCKLLGN